MPFLFNKNIGLFKTPRWLLPAGRFYNQTLSSYVYGCNWKGVNKGIK